MQTNLVTHSREYRIQRSPRNNMQRDRRWLAVAMQILGIFDCGDFYGYIHLSKHSYLPLNTDAIYYSYLMSQWKYSHVFKYTLLYGHKRIELEELDRIPRDRYKEISSVWVAQNHSGAALGQKINFTSLFPTQAQKILGSTEDSVFGNS